MPVTPKSHIINADPAQLLDEAYKHLGTYAMNDLLLYVGRIHNTPFASSFGLKTHCIRLAIAQYTSASFDDISVGIPNAYAKRIRTLHAWLLHFELGLNASEIVTRTGYHRNTVVRSIARWNHEKKSLDQDDLKEEYLELVDIYVQIYEELSAKLD